jgi:AraC-like DNA-binding protein/effector-binding domain-containing protein
MRNWKAIQPALSFARRNLDRNVALGELATQTGQSDFQAHRTLRAALGETPKQFTLRLRVDCAAADLVGSSASILEIALECGFESHEAFCRAFRRRFGMSPSAYRNRGLAGSDTGLHERLVKAIGPCIGLYRFGFGERSRRAGMAYEIERRDVVAQPVLVVRRRVRRSEIAAAIGAALPRVFLHAQRRGVAIAGYPITRYLETSVGLVTFETGMRVSGHGGEWTAAEGEGEVLAETLPAGPVAVTIHSGPYDRLAEAYAALEEWIAAQGLRPNGAPWEAYLNDPADHPDPQDWKTEVYWPLEG